MFRILLKVHKVQLRIKDEVDVQIVIKKGHENVIVPRKARLTQGIANFDAHVEFFVRASDPVFELYVMILHGSGKRFAGLCEINLNQWEENSNNATTSLLQKSPDTKATILFDFMYLSSDLKNPARSLVSLAELQSQKKSSFIREVQQKNILLQNENSRLSEEISALKRENEVLTMTQEQMAAQYNKKSEDYETVLRQKAAEREHSQVHLNTIKEKMTKLGEMVNNCEESALKAKISDLFSELKNIKE